MSPNAFTKSITRKKKRVFRLRQRDHRDKARKTDTIMPRERHRASALVMVLGSDGLVQALRARTCSAPTAVAATPASSHARTSPPQLSPPYHAVLSRRSSPCARASRLRQRTISAFASSADAATSVRGGVRLQRSDHQVKAAQKSRDAPASGTPGTKNVNADVRR